MNPRHRKWIFLMLPILPVWTTSADPPSIAQQHFQGSVFADTLKNPSSPSVMVTFPVDTLQKYTAGKYIRPEISDMRQNKTRHLLLTPTDKKHIYTRDLLLRPRDRFRIIPADSVQQKSQGDIQQ